MKFEEVDINDIKTEEDNQLIVVEGPFATRSGYGDHCRDIIDSLIDCGYNVKLVSTMWGNTPLTQLESMSKEEQDKYTSRLIGYDQLVNLYNNKSIDVYIQVTVPNEFKRIGKYNIGITAGIETNLCSPEWLIGCNNMDKIIVPSEHSKRVFEETSYQDNSGQILKLRVPIEVIFEGNRNDIYYKIPFKEYKTKYGKLDLVKQIDNMNGEYGFLFVGHWMQGILGEDRKNVSGLIYNFFHTFKDTPNSPFLVLKTSSAGFSYKDRDEILSKISQIKKVVDPNDKHILPNVYIIHGDLLPEEMNVMYNHPKIKTMISFTKGEGYGRPLQEFASVGKPVISTGWSGHLDFLNPEYNTLLSGQLKEVHSSVIWDKVINKGSKWFDVNHEEASKVMVDYFTGKISKNRGEKNKDYIKNNFSYEKMRDKFKNLIDSYNVTNIDIPNFNSTELPDIISSKG